MILFREWLFLSGPIGRLLQWGAEPGRRIEKEKTDAIFLALECTEDSLALQPSDNAAKAVSAHKVGSYFYDQDGVPSI